jgi:phage tail protein X
MSHTIYQTKTNERWDQIAYRAYGDSTMISGIIEANPSVAITDIIPQGTRLYIPINEETETFTNVLPPWKQ